VPEAVYKDWMMTKRDGVRVTPSSSRKEKQVTPSIRLRIGKPPFAFSVNIPIEDVVGAVVGLFSQPQQSSTPSSPLPVYGVEKHLHVLVHANGEVDIPVSTEQEAVDAAQKVLKQVALVNPKLYRVQGDFRALVREDL
jgi:hypothetical protein